MIRINLLPHKREARREAGQGWLVALLVVMAVEIIGLALYHQVKLAEFDKQRKLNQELETQIATIEATVKNHTDVKARLEALRAREDAIAALLKARSGPTAVLLELAQVLTPGRGPSMAEEDLAQKKKDNPNDVHNLGWDARRLWITNFTEQQRTMRIEGMARDGEDVSELARRMALSRYFQDVTLLPATSVKDAASGLQVVKFQLQAKVRY